MLEITFILKIKAADKEVTFFRLDKLVGNDWTKKVTSVLKAVDFHLKVDFGFP